MEQSGDLHPQRPESAAIPGTLRRGHHPQPEEQRLHLQDHLRQGEPGFGPAFWPGPDQSVFCLKSRYWGSDANKNEVQGTVLDQSGNVIHSFGGLWHEGIFCDTLPTPKCIWKPGKSVFIALLQRGRLTGLSPHRSTAKGLPPLLRLLHLRHGAE